MEAVDLEQIECGIAKFVLPGQQESGDQHLVSCWNSDLVIAVVDGLGHGREAADAATAATSALAKRRDGSIISTVEYCHEQLRWTRGVTLSLAFIDVLRAEMRWLGIGNVQGVLLRADLRARPDREVLLLRAGVVGDHLPQMRAAALPISPGDTLMFATDGVRIDFTESLVPLEAPQRAADRILRQFHSGTDDALVFVVRFNGVRP